MPAPSIGPVLLRLRLIGQMEAWTLSSESILPTGRKTRALLAIIALFAPRPVLRGRMAEMLWSRRPEEQARASLRQEIHRLHDALDPIGNQVLAITRDHLALRPAAVWVDVEELLRATPTRPAALGLYDGELLEGLDGIDPAFDGWLNGERQRLGDRARTVAETMLREQTDPEQMITLAQQLLRIDRSHEGAWRALMRAHLANGERGMAIQAYERCRLVLADQLDAQPSAETQRLLADIRNNAPAPPRLGPGSDIVYPPGGGSGRLPPPRLGARLPAPPQANGSAPAIPAEPALRAALSWSEFRDAEPRPGFAEQQRRLEIAVASRSPTPRGGPRLGVLPLQLIGTTQAEAHLSIGLAEDITSGLARCRWLWLAPPAGLARVANQNRDCGAIGEAFGLDFLVDGVVQRGGERIRVSLRAIDLRDGQHEVWSRRFEGSAQDLLTLQDEAVACSAAQIDPEMMQIEARRAAARPGQPSAYDLMMRALALMARLEKPRFLAAADLLRQAAALQPDSAAVHGWQAYCHLLLAAQGWSDDLDADIAEAARLADRAVVLDPQDARVLSIAGHVRACLQRRPREALALHDRALSLNPNLAMAWGLSGLAHAYLGQLDEAERQIARARHLAPMDPNGCFADAAPVLLKLLRREHRAAADFGRDLAGLHPAFSPMLKPYLAALGHLHEDADAAAVRARLLENQPELSVRDHLALCPLARPEDRAHFSEGLILAGFDP